VVAYLEGQLNAQFPTDAQLTAGAQLSLYGYIQITDGSYKNPTQRTDYSLRQIGDGLAGGSVMTHTVRAGDTLQSLAQMYFGSSAYWYLIADANGLQGSEPLAEGRVLQIPNQIANSINNNNTFKVYNESEIIGSTSPEIRTVEKKKKWWQKLVMILIVVIMIVAAVVTAGAALALAGPAAAGMLASLGTLGAIGAGLAGTVAAATLGVAAAAVSLTAGIVIAAGIGAVVYAGASILTQGLAIAAKLQDGFDWHAVGKAAKTGAISGAAAAITAGYLPDSSAATAGNSSFSWTQAAVRVGVEAGVQLAENGKITSYAGLITAAIPGGAAYKTATSFGLQILEARVRGGDNGMTWAGIAGQAIGAMAGQYQYGKVIGKALGDIAQIAIASQKYGSEAAWDMAMNKAGTYIGEALGSGSFRQMVDSAMNPQVQYSTTTDGSQSSDQFVGPPAPSEPVDTSTMGQVRINGRTLREQEQYQAKLNNSLGLPTGGADNPASASAPGSAGAQPASAIAPVTQETLPPENPAQAVARNEPAAPSQPRSVRAGDYKGSLERIARDQLGPDASQREVNNYVGQLFEINGITNARTIQPNQEIMLPGADTAAATSGLQQYGKDIGIGEKQKADQRAAAQAQAASVPVDNSYDRKESNRANGYANTATTQDAGRVTTTTIEEMPRYDEMGNSTGATMVVDTTPNKMSYTEQMGSLANGLHVPQGNFKNQYDQAVAGMFNSNNTVGERIIYGVLGTALTPMAGAEELARGVLNIPSAAAQSIPLASQAGTNTAIAMDSSQPMPTRIEAGLAATRDASFAFLGLAGLATVLKPTLEIGLPQPGLGVRGALIDANFAQVESKLGKEFSDIGKLKYSELAGSPINTVDDLANALTTGVIKPHQIPIDFVEMEGTRLMLNTRTTTALDSAGIPRSEWHGINRTGQIAYGEKTFDQLALDQLKTNGYSSMGRK
jgi:LysM domain